MVCMNIFNLDDHVGKKLEKRVKEPLGRLHRQGRHLHHGIFLATSSSEGFG